MADSNHILATDCDGGCLCGAVRYRVVGPIRNLCFCHCESCRRASGGSCVAWGTIDRNRFVLQKGVLKYFRSSAHVERGFCSHCGSSLTYSTTSAGNEIDITLASLDDPAPHAPQRHIWLQDKLPWVAVHDGLPQHQTQSANDSQPHK